MNDRGALTAAYRAARYLVLLDEGALELGIGAYNEAGEARLAAATGGQHWAIVTPCNPGSVAMSHEENHKFYSQMRGELEAMSQAWKPTLHRDPLDLWPDEPGFLLIEPPPGRAAALGRRYRQNALVLLRRGNAPELQWLD